MSSAQPQVSVILATHRDDGFLDAAIQSILDQKGIDFELIVVANNCTDDLWTKIQQLKDPRIRSFRTQIPQLSFNLNFALDQARGELIARMDSDDISQPDRLKFQYEFMRKHPEVAVLGSQVQLIDLHGKVIGTRELPLTHKEIVRRMKCSNCLCHPSVMFRKSQILGLGGYLGGRQSEDYQLWLRGIAEKKLVFGNLPETLLQYRVNPNSAQGSPLAYSEMVGHFAQLFLEYKTWYFFVGLSVALLKRLKKFF